MAVAKLPLTSFENPGLGQTLLRWRWLLVFMVVAWALAAQIPGYLALGPSQSLGNTAVDHGADQPGFWYSSPGMRVDTSAGQLHWESQATGNHWASRALAVPGDAEFVQLRFCLAKDVAPEAVAVMLASVREGALDFTRQYRVNSFYAGAAGECFAEPIPRRPGDGPAVLQVQLLDAPAALYLQSLAFEALRENPRWRITRWSMLILGLGLLVMVFSSYRRARLGPLTTVGLLTLAGLLTVLVILFGCCVSVSLKADIYALLTGGRSSDAGAGLQSLLQVPFPLGGFSLFTFFHAVLFCGATFFLRLVRRHAWLDMLLLAPVTETLQLFVPGRGPGTSDMLVDWFGVAVALPLVFLLRRSQRVRSLLEHQRIHQNTPRLGK